MKSARTQYSVSHFFKDIHLETQKEEKKSPLFIKIPAHNRKKQKEIGINTVLSFAPNDNVSMEIEKALDKHEESTEDESTESESEALKLDPTYVPDTDGAIPDGDSSMPTSLSDENKFIVFWCCLQPLLRYCLTCNAPANIVKSTFKGTMLIINMLCTNCHETVWHSQPKVNGMAAGNLIISAGILFSGNTFQRIKELADITKIPFLVQLPST